ncbi:MAG: class I SAM-dependent methyltransferase [Alphaproteobacteria bacterium]
MTDASQFDPRDYPVVDAAEGYGEWAADYESTVAVGLDRPLLERLASVSWAEVGAAADLACGTGRTAEWLRARGVGAIDGVDITPQMQEQARAKNVYRSLTIADVASTGLAAAAYDLVIMALACEHLAELAPVYGEAARLLRPGGQFAIVGYHPFFLLNGKMTHYHRGDGEAVAIRSYVHLFDEHVAAGNAAALRLDEMRECVIDEAWLTSKPKWRPYLHWPVSYGMVWRKN